MINNPYIETEYIYTPDMIMDISNRAYPEYPEQDLYSITFKQFLQLMDYRIDSGLVVNLDDTKLVTLWKNYIVPKYHDYVWFTTDREITPEVFIELVSDKPKLAPNLAYKVASFINGSYEIYSKLIDAYNVSINDLTAKITSSTVVTNGSDTKNVFNDTPQTNEDEELFDDQYATNTNHSIASGSSNQTTQYDTNYLIDKLENVREKLVNLYDEWSDRFAEVLVGFNY